MSGKPDDANHRLEEFRAYLETLTWIQLDPRLRCKFGLSDVIQDTLLEAYRDLERIEAMDTDGQKRWLRRMLINNLLDEIERWSTKERDFHREKSLHTAAEESSSRLRDWLAAEDSTPSEKLVKHEEAKRVWDALAQLPERERKALILQQYHGWKLVEIAEYLGCTANAVAGLLQRGLARLRKLLGDKE
jgi:RNA polymerase sigma-70 factor (ECF subfamily)